MKTCVGLLSIIALIGLIFLGGNMAKAEEVVCSALNGQLVDASGAPVAGVAVERKWSWRGKSGQDVVQTDPSGRFSFPEVPAKRGLFGWLPAEEAVVQRYFAALPEGKFEFLFISRRDLTPGGEAAGRPFNLRCRIGVEPGDDSFAWGTCDLI